MTLTKGHARNAAKTPLDQRLADMALISANTDGFPRSGVVGGANASIVTVKPTMSVDIATAEFATSKSKSDGVFIFTNDGTVSVPVSAAPTANSRYTIVWVKHNDDTTGDANALPIFGTTDGAAAASPVEPSTPSGALRLAVLRIYAGTTSTDQSPNAIVNNYRMTSARGGVVSVRTTSDRDSWTAPPEGQRVYVMQTYAFYTFVNGVWVHDGGRPELGNVSITGTNLKNRTANDSYRPRARKQSGTVFLEGSADVSATTTWVTGTTYTFGTIPAGFRPAVEVEGLVRFGATFAVVVVQTSGNIFFQVGANYTANADTLAFPLTGISYPDAALG